MRNRILITLAVLGALLSPAAAQSKKKVVLSGTGSWYSPFGPKEVADFQAASPRVTVVAPKTREEFMAEVVDADGIIGTVNPQIVRAAKKLKWVQVHSAGVDTVLFPEMKNSDIKLTNCKIVQGPEIADHALAMLLALTRDLPKAMSAKSREEWVTRTMRPLELQGKTAIVIGVGGIGTQIAIRAKAFGMQVIGVDPRETPPNTFIDRWYPPDRIDEVLPEAHVVFVSAPATKESYRMIGPKQFSLMRKDSYFVAVSRGFLYDLNALVQALDSKHLAGAGVDVTDPEPLPKGHPLWKFENVMITPHIAGRSDGEHARYMKLFKDNIVRFGNDEPLINQVDKQKGY